MLPRGKQRILDELADQLPGGWFQLKNTRRLWALGTGQGIRGTGTDDEQLYANVRDGLYSPQKKKNIVSRTGIASYLCSGYRFT
jgi:hypothetical protein